MEKKLPSVYANPIDKKIENVQEMYYEGNRSNLNKRDGKSVERKISDIFSSRNFVYKSQVLITTENGVQSKTIVGRTGISLLDMSGEVIPISTILDIEKQ